ncbi:MAG: polysaccharide biosynthesis protein PslH [Solirubrobacteraceae bacterium]|nr:polysaccharide biosynthesis protein PslH [Solirubrobacteraceae bacterium]
MASPMPPSGVPGPAAEVSSDDETVPRRILLVVPFAPRFDIKHGGRVVAQLIDELVTRHRVAVVYQRLPGEAAMDSRLAAECDLVRDVPLSINAPLGRRLQGQQRILTALLTGRPTAVSAIFSRRFASIVSELARVWEPDVTQIEHDALGYCLPALDALPTATVLVCHEPGLHASQDLVSVSRGRRRLAHRVDVSAWRRYWRRTLPHADAVVTFTDADADAISEPALARPVVRIPLGITLPHVPSNPVGGSPPTIVFIGGYLHPPNIDAAMTLMRGIMPLVRREMPGLRLTLVGDRPPSVMLRSARPGDEITGAVSSVAPYVDAATLIVLPIRLGGGMRVKLLEALAAGKAVIASPLATAGLAVRDGHELRFAETDAQFADLILELLADEEARRRLGAGARAWAVENLDWAQRVHRYEDLYASVLAAPGRRLGAARPVTAMPRLIGRRSRKASD